MRSASEQEDRQEDAADDDRDDQPDDTHLTSFVAEAVILIQRLGLQGVVVQHRVVPWMGGATPEHREHAQQRDHHTKRLPGAPEMRYPQSGQVQHS